MMVLSPEPAGWLKGKIVMPAGLNVGARQDEQLK
jgi:hypothetical protein